MCSEIYVKFNINMHFYITNAIFVMQKATGFWGTSMPCAWSPKNS